MSTFWGTRAEISFHFGDGDSKQPSFCRHLLWRPFSYGAGAGTTGGAIFIRQSVFAPVPSMIASGA
jgi:hypothetical protein